MALRNQPYFPLYVNDYLTDEKLNMCSWETQGIYIKILCVLHKQECYGKILFKQNDKQNSSTCINFASYLASILIRHIPCEIEKMEAAIMELLAQNVLKIDNDGLYQSRMVHDGEVSKQRSTAAKKGGGNPVLFKQDARNLFKQKDKQNPENENENNKLFSLEDINNNSLDKSLSLKEKEDKESLLLVPVKIKEENLVKEKGVKKKVVQKTFREKRLVDVKEEDLAGEENGIYYARLALEIQQAIMLNMQEAGISTNIIESTKGKAIDEVKLMLTKHECTEQQLYEAIDFIREDRFWKSVILSISKFREKLPNLLIKINQNETAKGNNRIANERKQSEQRLASFVAAGLNGAGIEKG